MRISTSILTEIQDFVLDYIVPALAVTMLLIFAALAVHGV